MWTRNVFFLLSLGVLLGLYKFNAHKYNFGNLTKLCAPPAISGNPSMGGMDPRLGNNALHSMDLVI